LGGALGVPGWVLLRQEDEWRWLAEGESTLWYPSVRLFRSRSSSRATKPIESLRDELLKRLENPAEEQRMRSVGRPHWSFQAAPERAS
jgi:hypothetical protein